MSDNMITENQELLSYVCEYIKNHAVGVPIYKSRLTEQLHREFGIDKRDSKLIAAVAFDKIMDTGMIPNLRLYRKGIYYRTESTSFGEIGINKERLISDKYLLPDMGYETGFAILHRMGLTSQMPSKRVLVSNAVKKHRIDLEFGVEIDPPRVNITAENKLYFQVLDMLEMMNHAPIDAENPYRLIADHIQKYELQYEMFQRFAEQYYNENVLSNLDSVRLACADDMREDVR